MLYLTDKYDKEGKASYSRERDPQKYYEVLQWLFFQNAGVGPMQGQANRVSVVSSSLIADFYRYAPEKIKYAIDRYQNETRRLYRVLDTRLRQNGDYLVGDHITIGTLSSWRI
jgi:glutathione S-transferase